MTTVKNDGFFIGLNSLLGGGMRKFLAGGRTLPIPTVRKTLYIYTNIYII